MSLGDTTWAPTNMTTLSDAKLTGLEALTGNTGHVNDLEAEFLVVLGATAGKALVDQWFEVFDTAAVSTGHFNERAIEYIVAQVGAPPSDDYNAHWQHYWENVSVGPVGPQPPGTPLLWYDFADPSTVFSDFAGTVLAAEGDNIRNITDKGTQGQDLADSGSGLIYNEAVINGLNAALSTAVTAMDNNFGFGTSGAGLTFACVAKHHGVSTQQKVFNWDGLRQIQQDELGSGNWECVVPNVPTTADTGAPVVDGEFIGVYLKHNNSLDFDVRASGQAEVVGSTIDFFNVGAFETFQIGVFDGHISEVLVYESFLDATDSQALLDYFDAKYGTLPQASVNPPAFANVQHWWDITDPLTVFEDTAQTIAATDGSLLRSIVDKGTALEDLTEAGAAVPSYFTDIVNGLAAGRAVGAGFGLEAGGFTAPGAAAGESFFLVGRHALDAAGTEGPSGIGNLDVSAVQYVTAPDTGVRVKLPGFGVFVDTGHLIVDGEWIWTYGTIDSLGDWRIRTAGSVEVTGNTAYSARDATNFVNMLSAVGTLEVTEFIVWDTDLSVPELAALIAYADAKYGEMPFLTPPPTVVDLIHWYDFTDNSTVFRNTSGTQLAADGNTIRLVTNKGSDGTSITSASGPVSPIYREGVVNGLNIADYDAVSKKLDAVIAAGQSSSINGLSMALVFRWKTGPAATNSMTDWGSNLGRTTATRFGQWFIAGAPGNVSSLGALGQDTWYLGAFAFDGPGAGTDRWRWSGEALQTAILGFLSDISAGSTLEIANAATFIEVAEFAVWDGQLSAAEFDAIFDYADNKYGTLPIFAPPLPATGSLTHHVDPSDASTVWADAAATIPAINGGTVDRIDNKGTDGTPLASVTGSPIYRTGVLNGTNIIEFSGANLTALAVAAGLTISTTGYTIAMVTRRRASHIGDSILWRWTPFAGSPGPSLRGRFALNGNFHRADPIPDEDLVANPSVIDQWYLLYFSAEAGGATDDAKFGSPGPEVAGPWADLTDIAPGSDVRYGTSSTLVEHAEAWFWNRPLTSAERLQLIAFADAKYGTLPHL